MQVFYAPKMRRFMGFLYQANDNQFVEVFVRGLFKIEKKRKKMLTRKYAKFIF